MDLKGRYFASMSGSFFRLLLTTAVSFYIAKKLGPVEFGNYSYLVVILTGLVRFIDASVSKAYFTFLSSSKTNSIDLINLSFWYLLQYIIVCLVLSVLANMENINLFELNFNQTLVIAFTSIFIQQRVWVLLGYVLEFLRETVFYQKIFSIGYVTYTALILSLIYFDSLIINNIFLSILIVWLIFSLILAHKIYNHTDLELITKNKVVANRYVEYTNYCAPLLPLAALVFIGEFVDRWALQKYGGSSEQGFFSLAKQISLLSLVATTSVLNTFWRELTYLKSNNKEKEVGRLVNNTTVGLYIFAVIISTFIIPWSGEILRFFFGDEYKKAALPFAIMMIFPIHQVIGQVAGVILMALSKSKTQLLSGVFSIIVGLLATATLVVFNINSGGFDATLISVKLVVVQFLSVSILSYYINKRYSIKIIGIEQLYPVVVLCLLSFVIKYFIVLFIPVHNFSIIIIGGLLYCALTLLIFIFFPKIVGISDEQHKYLFRFFKKII